jgi:hypothetical protein
MGFLAPWFLGGLFAIGLPVFLHLLQQHRSVPLPFSSLMFFEKRTQSSVKHRRLKYLLLFAMRVALIALLALAFANPFVNRVAAGGTDGRKFILIAVDNSFSMRSDDHLNQAKQQAANVLSNFGGADVGQVITFDAQISQLTQPVNSAAELRTAVQSIKQGDGRSAYTIIAQYVKSLAQSTPRGVEVHIFSDMQNSSLPPAFAELSVPGNARYVLHSVSSGNAEPNWFVESVNAPRSVYQAKKTRILAVVAGTNTEETVADVSMVLNGKTLETKKVKLAPNGRATVEFFLPDAAYGLNRGEIRIASHDKLPDDDRMYFSLDRKEPGRILFVHEGRQRWGAFYYRAALNSGADAGLNTDDVTVDQTSGLSPEKYSFVVLSDVGTIPATFEQALQRYVQGGGSVLIALGPVAAIHPRVPVFDAAITETRYSDRSGDRFQTAASVDAGHPALSRTNGFEGVKFYQTVKVDPGQARVLARLTDRTPLILEKKIGEGRALVFTSTFDNISNDLPLHASFVPFVEQSASYLSGIDQTAADFAVDSYVDLHSAKDQGAAVEVVDPDGKRPLSLREAASAQTLKLSREGFWELRRANGRHELLAVHADRRESDLTPVPKGTLELWENLGQGQQKTTGPSGAVEQKQPVSLWWYFVLALFIVSFAESLFGSRYLVVEKQAMVRKEAA